MTPRRHWHFLTRHVHPDWHGHDARKPGDRPHWHLIWRHRHTLDGR